ncbi:hypothetical protein BKA56DRAFT_698563 [Ilyonectria sp. MPI-CAGE-AT-0026]|nr:hypothetical protein BKA56DRAFT_698563 [Ilyonectria sp. MPI-CAGE-AT-0026]
MLAVIETLPVLTSSAEYEAGRHLMLQEFAAVVLKELILPKAIILTVTEDYDARTFTAVIASQELIATQVATAFAKRAIIANQCSNCHTDGPWMVQLIRPESSMHICQLTARQLDLYTVSQSV